MVDQIEINIPEYKRGFYLITSIVERQLTRLPEKGILHLSIQHTSAGLSLNENADPSVRYDFEQFIDKLIPENLSYLTHTLEGSDDMPAHLKASIIGQTVTIPITNGRMNLGQWQGIYLCEFRNWGGKRKIIATILS